MKHSFQVQTEVDESSGEVVAVYFRLRRGRVAETREVEDGIVFADYNRKGELVGIELLGPCHLSVLEKLVRDDPPSERFVGGAVPREMALA